MFEARGERTKTPPNTLAFCGVNCSPLPRRQLQWWALLAFPSRLECGHSTCSVRCALHPSSRNRANVFGASRSVETTGPSAMIWGNCYEAASSWPTGLFRIAAITVVPTLHVAQRRNTKRRGWHYTYDATYETHETHGYSRNTFIILHTTVVDHYGKRRNLTTQPDPSPRIFLP